MNNVFYMCDVSRLVSQEGNLSWEQNIEGEWKKVRVPLFYFDDPQHPSLDSSYATRYSLQKLGYFLKEHAPWSLKWSSHQLRSFYPYASEPFGVNVPQNIDYLTCSLLATCTPLVECGLYTAAFDDGFYCDTVIYASPYITSNKDLKETIKLIYGTYDRSLVRAVKQKAQDPYFLENLVLSSIARGIPKENIVHLIDYLFVAPSDLIIVHGVTLDSQGRVDLPQWFRESKPSNKVKWIKEDRDLVLECISLTHGQEIEFDWDTNNIYLLHNRIIDSINARMYETFVSSEVELYLDVSKFPEDMFLVSNTKALVEIGKTMRICIGEESYQNRLLSKTCYYVIDHKDMSDLAVAEIDARTLKILQHKGYNNKEVTSNQQRRMNSVISELKDQIIVVELVS